MSVDALKPIRHSVKKDILRQAVQENVRTMEGRPVAVRRPEEPPSSRSRPIAILVAILLSAGGVAGAWMTLHSQDVATAPPPLPATGLLPAPSLPVASAAIAATTPDPNRLVGAAHLQSAVFPVVIRKVVLDPGHGGKDAGTSRDSSLSEKELTLDIAQRLQSLLEERASLEVLLTRQADEHVVLKDRAQFANEAGADLFVSIHLNWLEQARRGVETFYLGPTEDPYLVELTSRENRGSGYSMADVRALLDGIYLDLRQEQSQRLAVRIQEALHAGLVEASPGLRDRGVKPAPFLVLVATDMPAILAEVSCLSHREEVELLQTDAYRQRIAEALFEGIDSYARGLSGPAVRGS
jgi:N-acetylmuramoyl-L-alanine amidase